jgi:hypothetical protein
MVKYFCFLILFSVKLFPQVLAVASVDSSDYEIGDFIAYTIQVEYDDSLEIMQPLITDSLKNIDLISVGEPQITSAGGKQKAIYKFILAKYDSADVTIPQIPIYYNYASAADDSLHSVLTNAVSFTVHSLQVGEEIKDVKEPITIPLDWREILLYVLIILLAAALLVYLFKKFKKKKRDELPEKVELKIPPHVQAIAELDQLERKKLWQNGFIKEYHSEITEIIRRYFERRFNFPALELTTTEAITFLAKVRQPQEIIILTEEFLNNADLVKFAKYQPMDSVNIEMMNQAKEIVDKTTLLEKRKEVENV